MERKDAVYWLNNLIGNYSDYYDDALEMGVKALEQQEIVRCGECKHKKDYHYENHGEEPYIKSTCENKYGLVKNYQVHDWDFCSRAERRTE